jgi:hypothetical protein
MLGADTCLLPGQMSRPLCKRSKRLVDGRAPISGAVPMSSRWRWNRLRGQSDQLSSYSNACGVSGPHTQCVRTGLLDWRWVVPETSSRERLIRGRAAATSLAIPTASGLARARELTDLSRLPSPLLLGAGSLEPPAAYGAAAPEPRAGYLAGAAFGPSKTSSRKDSA